MYITNVCSNNTIAILLLCRYTSLLPFASPSNLTELSEEFVQYQLLDREAIPELVWKEARVEDAESEEDDRNVHYHLDAIWQHLSTMKGGDGRLLFKRLSQIAKLVLVIPHSNAAEERVFSMVRKNKTPFRPNLGLDKTLPSLLTVKLATDEPCHKYEPPEAAVKKAGKVTWEYNKEHRKP